jgi:hypothetical protein
VVPGTAKINTRSDRYRAPVTMIVALLGVVLLGALAVFQASLVAGAPWGRFAWGGRYAVLPTNLRVGSAVSIALYALFAVLMLQAAGAVEVLPRGLVDVGIWILTGYLVIGVVMNAASRSRSERLVMTPVVLALAAVCLVLAVR